jgi:Fic family protein
MYIHERAEWPNFCWDEPEITASLVEARHLQGRLLGRMEALGFPLREEATLQTLTQDVVKTSEIEGEKLDARLVRSSLARRMGLDAGSLPASDQNVEGVVEMMLDATRNHDARLTRERLFSWHAALFPSGRSGMRRIVVGGWRTKESGEMQVVSGPIGRETIHYEAPGHERVRQEMARFIKWFNAPPSMDPVLKSGLAHFWFVTIHPFEDGNGRIARAIADMMLARSERTSQRFYSMSSQIQRERNDYYLVLERSQKGTVNISQWMQWYLNCMKRSIGASEALLAAVLVKAGFWKAHAGQSFNERQRKVINRLLDGFEGKLTSSKWSKLTKSSQDTALRDITDLLERGILAKESAGGRSTSYTLVLPKL